MEDIPTEVSRGKKKATNPHEGKVQQNRENEKERKCKPGQQKQPKKQHKIAFSEFERKTPWQCQMSLLLRRPPGCEAYPGDVFYLY